MDGAETCALRSTSSLGFWSNKEKTCLELSDKENIVGKTPSVLLLQGDCLELMESIPSGTIDMVLADLPYG